MRCPVATQSLKIVNGLLAAPRIPTMDPFFFEKVPAFAPRIIEYRWIATVLGDNQRIARRNFTIDWMDSVRSERLGMGHDIRFA